MFSNSKKDFSEVWKLFIKDNLYVWGIRSSSGVDFQINESFFSTTVCVPIGRNRQVGFFAVISLLYDISACQKKFLTI
jgi:hypothetical protein